MMTANDSERLHTNFGTLSLEASEKLLKTTVRFRDPPVVNCFRVAVFSLLVRISIELREQQLWSGWPSALRSANKQTIEPTYEQTNERSDEQRSQNLHTEMGSLAIFVAAQPPLPSKRRTNRNEIKLFAAFGTLPGSFRTAGATSESIQSLNHLLNLRKTRRGTG